MKHSSKRIIAATLATTMMFTMLSSSVLADNVDVSDRIALLYKEDLSPEEQGVRDFVARLYEVALGRTAETAGLDFWSDNILNGMPAVEVAQSFFESDEFLIKDMTDEEYVDTLYNTFFGRVADYDGKKFWVSTLEDGATRRYVLAGFANSDEFLKLCDKFGVTRGTFELNEATDKCPELNAFVALAYEGVLGRSPDNEGLVFWVNQLASGTTACEMLTGFFDSDEISNKDLTNEEFVTLCYRAFLLREPDEPGLQSWVDYFDQGLSKRYIMSRISQSQEFNNLCDEYGVTRGSVTVFEYRDMFPEYTKFINNAYIQMVGEAPTASQLNDYLSKLNKGVKTLRGIVEDIADLGSKREVNDWIRSLYKGALGRDCSTDELANQLDTLNNSGKDTVIESIVESGEFTSYCENLGIFADSTKRIERGANGALYGYSMDGNILTGWNYVDGLKYFFYEDGTLCQDLRDIIGDQDSYYLTINTANNIIMVYTWDDETDDWNIPVVAFVASCGRPGTETILGDFTLHSQSRWGLMMGDVYCQYLTRISGNFLIHSECYATTNVYTMDPSGYRLLGQHASHGCVRTTCANAKWVYEHCDGCSVHLYKDASVSAPFDKPVPPPLIGNGNFDPTDPLCN